MRSRHGSCELFRHLKGRWTYFSVIQIVCWFLLLVVGEASVTYCYVCNVGAADSSAGLRESPMNSFRKMIQTDSKANTKRKCASVLDKCRGLLVLSKVELKDYKNGRQFRAARLKPVCSQQRAVTQHCVHPRSRQVSGQSREDLLTTAAEVAQEKPSLSHSKQTLALIWTLRAFKSCQLCDKVVF